jgi:single-strand DNA-binding protein
MSEHITVAGLIATTPRHLVTQDGLPITSFRLAASQRRFDRVQNKWIDGETNWYTVSAFRQLAINSSTSLSKGDRIVLTGKLRVRDWDNGERAGTAVEIEAEAIGHDLSWGSSDFTRTVLVREVNETQVPSSEPASDADALAGERELVGAGSGTKGK